MQQGEGKQNGSCERWYIFKVLCKSFTAATDQRRRRRKEEPLRFDYKEAARTRFSHLVFQHIKGVASFAEQRP